MKLGIVVPYRDRRDHLSQFVPHVCDFFEQHSFDVRIIIVEQPPGLPFNRGLICNIGYQIIRKDTGFVCFHDVDYLPVSADHSCPALPTMVIRHGLRWPYNPKELFSAVVLLQKQHFEQANGFSNDYWGWGFEDIDLKQRLAAIGLCTQHRDGTFTPLPHARQGRGSDGRPTPAKIRNAKQLVHSWSHPGMLWKNTAGFNIAHRKTITHDPIFVEHALVGFSHCPS